MKPTGPSAKPTTAFPSYTPTAFPSSYVPTLAAGCPVGQYYPSGSTVCTNCPAGTSSDGVGGPCTNCPITPNVQSSVAGGYCLDTCTSSDANCGVALKSGDSGACVCASCNDGSVATDGSCPVSTCYGAYPTLTCDCTIAVFPPGVRTIADNAFANCPITTAVIIPTTVTSIGYFAFGFSGLATISIPNTVTSIGSNAFAGCTQLTGVTIPGTVTRIGDYAFYGCTSLSCVSIPHTVTSIGYQAFSYDPVLTSVNVPAGVSYSGGTTPSSVSSSFDCTPTGVPTSSPSGTTICSVSWLTTTVIVSNTPTVCCLPGYYNPAGSSGCTNCPAGKSSVPGGSCTNCPAGTSSVGGGLCTNCPNHQSSLAGGSCLMICTSTDIKCAVALPSGAGGACVCASCNAGTLSVAGGSCLDICTSTDANCGVALKSTTSGACACASCNDGSIPSTGTSCPVPTVQVLDISTTRVKGQQVTDDYRHTLSCPVYTP